MQGKRELEIVDQTQHKDMFRGSNTQLYVPAFTRKDFHYIVYTGLPTQGTSTEDLVVQTWSTQLLSQLTTTSTLEVRHNNNHLYT